MKSIYRGLIKSKEKTDRMEGWVGGWMDELLAIAVYELP